MTVNSSSAWMANIPGHGCMGELRLSRPVSTLLYILLTITHSETPSYNRYIACLSTPGFLKTGTGTIEAVPATNIHKRIRIRHKTFEKPNQHPKQIFPDPQQWKSGAPKDLTLRSIFRLEYKLVRKNYLSENVWLCLVPGSVSRVVVEVAAVTPLLVTSSRPLIIQWDSTDMLNKYICQI
jgi:hypothetical protein